MNPGFPAAGLKGTSSHDVAVHGITVLTCSPMFDPPRHGGPLYRLSFWNLISAHIAGFPAGVGRRALDEFVVGAEGKHRRGSPISVADDPVVQHRFAVVDGDLPVFYRREPRLFAISFIDCEPSGHRVKPWVVSDPQRTLVT